MTDEQKSRVAEVKGTLTALGKTREGAPRQVREAAVALKRDLQRTGTTARVLAAALEVHESTLCRWEKEVGGPRGPAVGREGRARRPRFRMVNVAAPPLATRAPAPATSAPALRGLRAAHAPSGLVIDGLDVETLAALLRSMS